MECRRYKETKDDKKVKIMVKIRRKTRKSSTFSSSEPGISRSNSGRHNENGFDDEFEEEDSHEVTVLSEGPEVSF